MTRIDFYILPESATAADSQVMTACRLCDKACAAGKQVYVHAVGAVSTEIDSALWTFRQGGFVAHERFDPSVELQPPIPAVLIGRAEPPDSHHDILINLDAEIPEFFSRFERVLEIVAGDPSQRASARAHYKYYRDRGYELNTFEQSESGAWRQRRS